MNCFFYFLFYFLIFCLLSIFYFNSPFSLSILFVVLTVESEGEEEEVDFEKAFSGVDIVDLRN